MFPKKQPQQTSSFKPQQKQKQNSNSTFVTFVAFRVPDVMQYLREGFIQEASAREKGTMAETRLTAWYFISAFSTRAYSKGE